MPTRHSHHFAETEPTGPKLWRVASEEQWGGITVRSFVEDFSDLFPNQIPRGPTMLTIITILALFLVSHPGGVDGLPFFPKTAASSVGSAYADPNPKSPNPDFWENFETHPAGPPKFDPEYFVFSNENITSVSVYEDLTDKLEQFEQFLADYAGSPCVTCLTVYVKKMLNFMSGTWEFISTTFWTFYYALILYWRVWYVGFITAAVCVKHSAYMVLAFANRFPYAAGTLLVPSLFMLLFLGRTAFYVAKDMILSVKKYIDTTVEQARYTFWCAKCVCGGIYNIIRDPPAIMRYFFRKRIELGPDYVQEATQPGSAVYKAQKTSELRRGCVVFIQTHPDATRIVGTGFIVMAKKDGEYKTFIVTAGHVLEQSDVLGYAPDCPDTMKETKVKAFEWKLIVDEDIAYAPCSQSMMSKIPFKPEESVKPLKMSPVRLRHRTLIRTCGPTDHEMGKLKVGSFTSFGQALATDNITCKSGFTHLSSTTHGWSGAPIVSVTGAGEVYGVHIGVKKAGNLNLGVDLRRALVRAKEIDDIWHFTKKPGIKQESDPGHGELDFDDDDYYEEQDDYNDYREREENDYDADDYWNPKNMYKDSYDDMGDDSDFRKQMRDKGRRQAKASKGEKGKGGEHEGEGGFKSFIDRRDFVLTRGDAKYESVDPPAGVSTPTPALATEIQESVTTVIQTTGTSTSEPETSPQISTDAASVEANLTTESAESVEQEGFTLVTSHPTKRQRNKKLEENGLKYQTTVSQQGTPRPSSALSGTTVKPLGPQSQTRTDLKPGIKQDVGSQTSDQDSTKDGNSAKESPSCSVRSHVNQTPASRGVNSEAATPKSLTSTTSSSQTPSKKDSKDGAVSTRSK